MSDYKAVHETVLHHILTVYDALSSLKADVDKSDVHNALGKILKKQSGPLGNSRSIAAASSDLTLVFPVLCTRNISIEVASMITKALEKNDVSMLQKLFAAYQFDNNGDISDLRDYIKSFHTNIDTRIASLDDVFDVATRAYDNGHFAKHEMAIYESMIAEDMKHINYQLPSSINESSLMRYTVNEAAVVDTRVGEDDNGTKTPGSEVGMSMRASAAKDAAVLMKSHADVSKLNAEYFSKQVMDSDFKKANELMPTSMIVNYKVKTDTGVVNLDGGIIGVKAKLYPMASSDIVKHIVEKHNDSNWLMKFIKAGTREISFMKDLVLAIDKAKIDAMSLSTRKSSSDKMWKVLERRATSSRLSRAMKSGSNMAAITTLVISQEEVEYLRKNENIDIEQIRNVMNLFSSYNLMCLVIVDETLEVAKFIYDTNDPSWETISFTHLERESNDNTYKRVVNLMTKMSR